MFSTAQKQKGLTLTETLVGLIIIGILVALITPSIQIYYQQNRLKGAAENLYDNITLARTTAIEKATTAKITITTGAAWCYGMSSGAIACACGSAGSASNCDLGIVSAADYPGTTLATTLSGATTTFNAARGVPNNTGTVTFSTTSGGSQSVQLTLNALGFSSLCSPSGTVGGYAGC